MQHQGDQREATAAVLAALHESADGLTHLGRGLVADQATGKRQDPAITQRGDLGLEFVATTTETRGEPLDIEDRIGIAVEEDKDVPGQE